MPDCLTPTETSTFPLRALSIAVSLGLTSLLAGCSSTPQTSARKPIVTPNGSYRVQPSSARRVPRLANGRTYAVGGQTGNLQTSALDAESVDDLEALLEASDMDAVEGSKLAIMRYGDLWNRMRAGFKLDLSTEHSRTTAQRSWFASRQTYIDRLTARASRYLYHTVTEAERRGIPTELALLPVVESSYDPTATSNAAAAGMWQFIPSTGKLYGLRQNELYDGRRDVVESTRAAYDFLTSLYNQFGSWELALAAYNAGPGRVQNAINYNLARGLPTDYWSLRLPQETLNYVPRFLAVAQIIRDPNRSNLILPPIANRPHFRSVALPGAIDLEQARQVIGLNAKELYELNPAFARGQTDPAGPHRLLIPDALSAQVDERLSKLPVLAGGYANPDSLRGGAVVLSQSRGYSNAQVAALMGDGPTRASANLSTQITSRSNGLNSSANNSSVNSGMPAGVPAAVSVARVSSGGLPTSSAALAALANQVNSPNGAGRLAMPSDRPSTVVSSTSGSSTVAVTTRTSTVAPSVNPASNTSVQTASTLATSVTQGEPALSAAERQRLMSEGLALARQTTATPSTSTSTPVLTQTVTLSNAVASNTLPSNTLPSNTLTSTLPSSAQPLSASDKAQVIAEIQQIAPANTQIIDPLDGNIALSAIQTQQSVLEATGQTRQLRYEKPYLATSRSVTNPTANNTAASNTIASNTTASRTSSAKPLRPISMSLPTADIAKPVKPKGERTIYTVQAGDTLSAVASRYGVDIDDVANWNQMARNANLFAGTPLYLYGVKAPSKPTIYVVQAGDTLSGLATRFGLSNQQLADYNDLSPTANVLVGRKLNLIETPASKAASRVRKPAVEDYKVKAGESLIALAARYRISPDELAKLNDLDANAALQRGQTLRVPAGVVDDSVLDAIDRDSKNKDKGQNSARKVSTDSYTVKTGESLKSVAARYALGVAELANLNDLAADQKLQRGQVIRVPSSRVSSSTADDAILDTKAADNGKNNRKTKNDKPSTTDYTVKAGESLIVLATRYGLTPDEMAELNDFAASSKLQRGQRILVPAADSSDNATNTASANSRNNKTKRKSDIATVSYSVKAGENLISLANHYEIEPSELARLNNLNTNEKLQRGQALQVPDKGPKLTEYTVRSGDTMQRVAKKHGITLAQLAELNDIPVAIKLVEGDTINVPADSKGASR